MRADLSLLALSLILSLLGCITGPNSLRSRDVSLLPLSEPVDLLPGEGLLVFELTTNEVMPELTMASLDGRNPPLILRDLQPGRHTHLIRVPAGRYAWHRIEIMGYEYRRQMRPYTLELDLDNELLHFDVKEGVASYPGLLRATRKDRWITYYTLNRSGQLAERIIDKSRWLIERYPLRYTGRRRDDFLEFYSKRWTKKHHQDEPTAANSTAAETSNDAAN